MRVDGVLLYCASVLEGKQIVAAGRFEFDGGVPGPVGVAEEFAGEHDYVGVSADDGVFGLGWCGDHPACGHGNFGFPADSAGNWCEEGWSPRDAGQVGDYETVADIEEVKAGGFEFASGFDGFFQRYSAADPIGNGEPCSKREVFWPDSSNGSAGFEEEADPVFEAAAVVVCAVIGER